MKQDITEILRSWLITQNREQAEKELMPNRELTMHDLYDKINALTNQVTKSQISMIKNARKDPLAIYNGLSEINKKKASILETEIHMYNNLLDLLEEDASLLNSFKRNESRENSDQSNQAKKEVISGRLKRAKEAYAENWYVRVFCPYLETLVSDEVKPALLAFRKAGNSLATGREEYYDLLEKYTRAGLGYLKKKYGKADISLVLKKLDVLARDFVAQEKIKLEKTEDPYDLNVDLPTKVIFETEMGIPVDEPYPFYFTEFAGYFVVPEEFTKKFEETLAELWTTQDCLHNDKRVFNADITNTRRLLPGYDSLPAKVNSIFSDRRISPEKYDSGEMVVYDIGFTAAAPESNKSAIENIVNWCS